ncbi:MAG TPA: ubiquitin-conjugating enzyme E2 [Candidatus Angelobacter sp.]|jgi:ubiquitin-protein ligase|nr:ubiquitin-conjugating enzyme E2 [Candidatus Angelobacter sp.]
MLNPKIRARRLQAEYERVRGLHEQNGLLAIVYVDGEPPDRYVFQFTCRGIAEVVDDAPVYSDQHQVALMLTETYPTTAPLMEWLTPVFHPNIRADGQAVCIGSWYPAKTLDQLVLMLGEMIQYRNYASHDPLNLEASLWALDHKELFPVDDRLLLQPNRKTSATESLPGGPGEPEIQFL